MLRRNIFLGLVGLDLLGRSGNMGCIEVRFLDGRGPDGVSALGGNEGVG